MAFPDSLDGELFYLFVVGPGVGETVLLRLPPDQWVVVDSPKIDGRPAAEAVIERYGGDVVGIVLTHPHRDHYSGISDLIQMYPSSMVGCVHPKQGTSGPTVPADPVTLLKAGAKRTYDLIWDTWNKNDSQKWMTFRNAVKPLAGATFTPLHPVNPLGASDWNAASPNDMSSAMLVEWNDLRLLLGADVTNSSWPDIAAIFPDLADHHVMKVPHHGSKEAIHGSFGNGSSDRVWVVTPYANSRLPRADKDDGMSSILNCVSQFELTSLPFLHNRQNEAPCITTRAELANDTSPTRTGSITQLSQEQRAERMVCLAFEKSARLVSRSFGTGTVCIK